MGVVKGAIIDKIKDAVPPTFFDCCTLTIQGWVKENDLRCKLLTDKNVELWNVVGTNCVSVRASLSRADVNSLLDDMDGPEWAFDAGTYRKVKELDLWKEVYSFKKRTLDYANGFGPGGPEDSVFCDKCGLLLRADCVTVDHNKPQSGGGPQAILKLFRSMGLTVAGPKGAMGKRIWKDSVGGGLTPPGNSKINRYTMNDRGKILFSMVKWADAIAKLEEKALNHVLNLRPMCIHCNTSKGALLAFF